MIRSLIFDVVQQSLNKFAHVESPPPQKKLFPICHERLFKNGPSTLYGWRQYAIDPLENHVKYMLPQYFQGKGLICNYILYLNYIHRVPSAKVLELPQSHSGNNLDGTLFSLLHMCYAYLHSARFDHFVCCWSIYLPIYLERKIQGKERVNSILGGFRETPKFPPLVGHPNLPIRKTLRRVLGLLTEWFWKERVRVFSFKATNLHWGQKRSDKFFDEIESTDDYPIQDKKHLRTRRNLNWNPLIYQVGF